MEKRIIKYNPAFLSDEELMRSFTVRETDLDIIMRIIRENTTKANQHILVVGPRGIGKTTLLLRVGLEVRRGDLNDLWYPLVFSEESYSICNIGEFWLEALFHVAQQTGDEKWTRTIEELNEEKNDKILSEKALARLLDFSDALKKRILLIVENFNMLFDGQISEKDAWTFRHTLINEPRIMLLASATSRMDQVENSSSAMYELFKQYNLKPLDKEESRIVWESITGKPLDDDRIRPIQILTGGNPRLLTIISSFGSKLSFNELMDDLLNLVDNNTEYFKSHLDNLPPIERKAYLALAELWDPSPAKEIARIARLDVNKTSSLMARLISRGAVKANDGSKRAKLYQTTERMYNIYYLMRKRGAPSERVKAIVNFMVSFYGHDELMKVTRTIAEEACNMAPGACQDHVLTYGAILSHFNVQNLKEKIIGSTPQKFLELCKEYCPAYDFFADVKTSKPGEKKKGKRNVPYDATNLESLKSHLEKNPDDCEALLDYGKLLYKTKKYSESENVFRKLVKIRPECSRVWGHIGLISHLRTKNYVEAKKAYTAQLQKDPKDFYIWGMFAKLLQDDFSKYDEAERAYRKSISLKSDTHWVWEGFGQLLDEKLNRNEEAEQAYKKAIETDPNCVSAWSLLATLLDRKLGKYEEAEKAYTKLIDLDPKDYMTTVCLGQLLHYNLKRYDEAEATYNRAIKIKPENYIAWFQLASLMQYRLERYDEAERAYKKVLSLKPDMTLAQSGLVALALRKNQAVEGFRLANYYISLNTKSAETYDQMASIFFRLGPKEYLSNAREWSEQAISLEPRANNFYTYACVLAALNRHSDALKAAQEYIRDEEYSTKRMNDTIELFAALTVAGFGRDALDILTNSKIVNKVEPLIVGIRLYLGDKVQVATEVLEVAKDVKQRIQAKKDKMEVSGSK